MQVFKLRILIVVFLHIYFAIELLSDTSMDDVQLN